MVGSVIIGTNSSLPDIYDIPVPFFNLFCRWDSNYCMMIAQHGYFINETWAFRPLFPSFLSSLIPFSSPGYANELMTVAGFFLNNVFFLIAIQLVYNLTFKLFSKRVAEDSVLFLAFCPAAIFFTAIYPESLYLMLVAVSLFFVEEGFVFKSGIMGYLAGLARPEGIFTSIVIFLKSLINDKTKFEKMKSLVSILIVLSSLATFLFMAWAINGSFGIVFHVETSWPKVTLLQLAVNPSLRTTIAFYAISIPLAGICILAIFPFFAKKLRTLLKDRLLPYFLYAASLAVFFLAVGELLSLPRYFSTIIPVYWGLSLWFEKKPFLKPLIFLIFLFQLALGTILFTNWYYFI